MLVASISHKHDIPETVVAVSLFNLWRETVTTGKGLIVPLYKLKLLVSNAGSMLMASLL